MRDLDLVDGPGHGDADAILVEGNVFRLEGAALETESVIFAIDAHHDDVGAALVVVGDALRFAVLVQEREADLVGVAEAGADAELGLVGLVAGLRSGSRPT